MYTWRQRQLFARTLVESSVDGFFVGVIEIQQIIVIDFFLEDGKNRGDLRGMFRNFAVSLAWKFSPGFDAYCANYRMGDYFAASYRLSVTRC